MTKILGYFNRLPSETFGFACTGESMTQQRYKDECDINNIVDHNMRYKDPAYMTKMKLAGLVSDASPVYGDFSQVSDYQTALNTVDTAKAMFNALPVKVRDKFGSNPQALIDFVNNPVNYDEAVSLGLLKAKEVVKDVVQNPQVAGSNVDVEPISGTSPETSAQSLT